jgi:mono/diheme cytochrome c family protein
MTHRSVTYLWTLVMLVFALTACARTAEPAVTPTEEPTPTATIAPTLEATPTPTAEATPTAAATPATEPTPTLEATPTPTASPTPTAEATPTATLTPTQTAEPTPSATPTASPTPTVEASPTPDLDAAIIAMGETLFRDNCATCHGASGQGVGGFPALDGSQVVTANDPTAAIRQVLLGGGGMPAFQNVLNNEEIAALLSYVRTAWSNDASMVAPGQVAEQR